MFKLLPLAFRNLLRNRRRTAISLSALMVGTAAIIVLRGLTNGEQQMIVDSVVSGQLGAVQVHRKGYLNTLQAFPLNLAMEDSPELRQKLASVPGITGVAPRIAFGAMLALPDAPEQAQEPAAHDAAHDEEETDMGASNHYMMVMAIEPEAERAVTPKRLSHIDAGKPFDRRDADEMVINSEFASGAGLKVLGAERPDLSQWPALLAMDRDGTLNGENVVVGGSFLSEMPGDRQVGYLALGTAQRLLRMEGQVTEYALAVRDMNEAPRIRDALQAALGPEYEVHTWEEVVPYFRSLRENSDFVLGLLSSIVLFIVLLGVVNVVLMSVLERIREIGTLMAIGMRRQRIVQLFVLEGLLMGLLGGGLGVLLGWAAVLHLGSQGVPLPAPGSSVPSMIWPYVTFEFLVRSLVLACLGSALASLWPALKASRLRPVQALQNS